MGVRHHSSPISSGTANKRNSTATIQATTDSRMMSDPLQPLRQLCTSPSTALRWACILEATAPKVGNVFPGHSFEDLSHLDFMVAAEITSHCFSQPTAPISERMLDSIIKVRDRQGTNVNLGIVLLLGPLVAADEAIHQITAEEESLTQIYSHVADLNHWVDPIDKTLGQLDAVDGANIYRAINLATAGGLGTTDELDVNQPHQSVDILDAMFLAKDRDQIARQYSGEFRELILEITPILNNSIHTTRDVLRGICHAQINLLAKAPDTLIARKNGLQVALEVQHRARAVDPLNEADVASLDTYLRSDGHQLNPGTTADLLAAALYLLLRTTPLENDHE